METSKDRLLCRNAALGKSNLINRSRYEVGGKTRSSMQTLLRVFDRDEGGRMD
jgi:hypothetical protein